MLSQNANFGSICSQYQIDQVSIVSIDAVGQIFISLLSNVINNFVLSFPRDSRVGEDNLEILIEGICIEFIPDKILKMLGQFSTKLGSR